MTNWEMSVKFAQFSRMWSNDNRKIDIPRGKSSLTRSNTFVQIWRTNCAVAYTSLRVLPCAKVPSLTNKHSADKRTRHRLLSNKRSGPRTS